MKPYEHASPVMERLEGPASGALVWRGRFTAMANPCELLIETPDMALARQFTELAAQEAQRIEYKYSRYRNDGVIHAINNSAGLSVEVDAETAGLLDYGQLLWQLSDAAFDLTSGVLRRIWKFGNNARVPTQAQVDELLRLIGWQQVSWQSPCIALPSGMELDLGGIGKEYAVDCAAKLIIQQTDVPVLINFGGDLRTVGQAPASGAWRVGIESTAVQDQAQQLILLKQGALATSGDTRRCIEQNGKLYGHIIDARTGWPTEHAPRSMTVVADTCTQAGTYSTLAMLQGANAEVFLEKESVRFWCLR